ncbi:hypothetical protein JX043_004890 [Salmonella enterica]|nr:hypothetical protein [Salmonella enterica]
MRSFILDLTPERWEKMKASPGNFPITEADLPSQPEPGDTLIIRHLLPNGRGGYRSGGLRHRLGRTRNQPPPPLPAESDLQHDAGTGKAALRLPLHETVVGIVPVQRAGSGKRAGEVGKKAPDTGA